VCGALHAYNPDSLEVRRLGGFNIQFGGSSHLRLKIEYAEPSGSIAGFKIFQVFQLLKRNPRIVGGTMDQMEYQPGLKRGTLNNKL